MVWVIGVSVVFALLAGVWYLRHGSFAAIGSTFPIGVVAVLAGTLTADVSRFAPASPPLPAMLFGAALTGLGWVLIARAAWRNWDELICDAVLIGGCAVLGPTVVTMMLTTVDDTPLNSADLICLAFFALAAHIQIVFVPDMPSRDTLNRVFFAGYNVLRLSGWSLAFFDSAGVLTGLSWLGGVLCLAGHTSIGVFAIRQARGVEAVVQDGERTTTMPYLVTVATASMVLFGMSTEPQVSRLVVPAMSAVMASVLVTRQVITTRKLVRAGEAAEASERYYRGLVQNTSDVIMICDRSGRIEYASAAVERVLGITDDVVGEDVSSVLGVRAATVGEALAAAGLGARSSFEGQRQGRVLETVVGRQDERFVLSVRDVSERDELRRSLHELAFTDPLTGLANRQRLLEAIDEIQVQAMTTISVLFADLDGFKQVNDASGHAVGDLVLRQVADRLRTVVGPTRLLARLGGDEFVVVLCDETDQAAELAERIGQAVAAPFNVDERTYQLGVSIGIAHSRSDLSGEELLRRADIAMYRAKLGDRAWMPFDEEMSRQVRAHTELHTELARCWRPESITLFLQPVVDVGDRTVTAAEGLLRWRDRHEQVNEPGPMLAFASQTGRMPTLTSWVIDRAIELISGHPQSRTPIAINIPPALLTVTTLPEALAGRFQRAGIDPSLLRLEITEEAMVEHGMRALEGLHALRSHGFRLYVDDFGTGYSSLGYLVRLPLDGLKIDRSFTEQLAESVAARSLVRGLVGLSRDTGLDLVAEGVETAEQHDWLARLGVPRAQGYYYAKPTDGARLADRDLLSAYHAARVTEQSC